MSTRFPLCIALTAFALLPPACGDSSSGPDTETGPAADFSRSPAEIKAEVKAAETPVLEQAVVAYNEFIASKQGEVDALETQIKELGGNALDAVLGEGQTDAAKAELQSLQANVDALHKDIMALKERLDIYVQELAARG
jgi:polyhydroxyalkanoate synthesis regulator phasin